MPNAKLLLLLFIGGMVLMSLSVMAQTPLAGCTESASLIECTGSLTGQWLNNSDPNRVIWIHDATISASGFFNVTSEGRINITDTTINAQGSAGAAGSDDTGNNCGSCCGSITAGNGGSGTSGKTIIYSNTNVLIHRSTLNSYGGAGGAGGDVSCSVGSGDHDLGMTAGDAGNGGNGFINITAKSSLDISNSVTLNSYGGAGGAGGDASGSAPSSGCGQGSSHATNGANGGTSLLEMDSPSIKLSNTVIINNDAGDAGNGGNGDSSDGAAVSSGNGGIGGSSFFKVNTSIYNMSLATLSHSAKSAGAAGSRSVKASCGNGGQTGVAGSAGSAFSKFIFDSYAFFNSMIGTTANLESTNGIMNFTGLVNRMFIFNTTLPRYYTYCSQRLVLESSLNTTPFVHTNCTVNSVPIATDVMISSAQVGVASQGSFSYTDVDGDSLGGNETEWYVNQTKITTATNNLILGAGNFSNSANITFSVRLNDTYQFGSWYNSTPALVGDINPPTVNRNYTSSPSVVRDTPIQIFIDISDGGGVSFVKAEIQDPSSIKLNYSMSIYSGNAINGTWSYNYTPTALGNYGVLFYYSDGANNQNHTDTNLSFTSTTAPVSDSGGGGGGGGQTITQTIVVDETSKGCNLNKICEASRGEDFINCPTDCKFSVAALTCDDPTQACFFKNATAARIILVMLVISTLIVVTPQRSKEEIKKTLGFGR